MELLYDDAAKAAGVYVASAVGFDSVPGDLGVQVRGSRLIAELEVGAAVALQAVALSMAGRDAGVEGAVRISCGSAGAGASPDTCRSLAPCCSTPLLSLSRRHGAPRWRAH